MSALDYVGSTVDALVFQGFSDSLGDHVLLQSLGDDKGFGTIGTGIVKLAQRFLMFLLTETGSLQYVNAGTTFMIEARRGEWRTVADVRQSYYSALLDVTRQLRAVETDDDPTDEVFVSANLLQVLLNGDQVTLRIRFVSAALAITLIAPLNISIR